MKVLDLKYLYIQVRIKFAKLKIEV
jgi:hypothetical protein